MARGKAIRSFSTKADLEKLKPEAKPYFVWDDKFDGGSLGVRVASSGDASIRIQFRLPNGKTSKKTLHKLRSWLASGASLTDLRKEARNEINKAQATGLTTAEAKTTIAELGAAYLTRRAKNKPYKGAGNAKQANQVVERAALVWGNKPLTKLTTTDAEDLMDYIFAHHGPQAANKARGLLPSMLKFAARTQPTINSNLFSNMEIDRDRFKPQPRTAVLTAEDRPRFFETLRNVEEATGITGGRPREAVGDKCDALRLIYLCAARKNEWLQAVWGAVDLEAREWHRYERKNGAHTMKLPQAAVPILERIKARRTTENRNGDNDLIFGNFSMTQLRAIFKAVLAKAGIDPDLRIHDLRASRVTQWVIEEKRSEHEVAFAIGSKDVATLVRHYTRDSATEAQKLNRVDSEGDGKLI